MLARNPTPTNEPKPVSPQMSAGSTALDSGLLSQWHRSQAEETLSQSYIHTPLLVKKHQGLAVQSEMPTSNNYSHRDR